MEKFDQSYIEMASIWARNSYCKRRQVREGQDDHFRRI